MILDVILAGFIVFYLLQVFLLQPTTVSGPFSSKHIEIWWVEGRGTDNEVLLASWPLSVIDRVRRIFGLYYIPKSEKDSDKSLTNHPKVWYVVDKRAEVWRCPTCLTVWLSAPLTILITFVSPPQYSYSGVDFILLLLGTSGFSTALYYYILGE